MARALGRPALSGWTVRELRADWQLLASDPDRHPDPLSLPAEGWVPCEVPGTAAAALAAAGGPACIGCCGEPDIDGRDWWFRTRLRIAAGAGGAGERCMLVFEGIATVHEIWLDGELLHQGSSMFRRVEISVPPAGSSERELLIAIRALRPRLRGSRRPRARWRTRLVQEQNLRFVRTMLLGRAPGFAPGPPLAGPWRPARLECRVGVDVRLRERSTTTHEGCGRLRIATELLPLAGAKPTAVLAELLREPVPAPSAGGRVPRGEHSAQLRLRPAGDALMAEGELIVQRPDLWWPHTHGEPALYRLRLSITLSDRDEPLELDLGSVGFRAIDSGDPAGPGGLRLSLNGAEVFARGAVWTPDLLHPSPERAALREVLQGVRDCGMNMLRIPGTAAYESEDFYDLCDELGIMVWQDLPFANLDYPESDPDFMAEVEAEVGEALLRLQGRPSPTVLCGSSEIAQQVAMLGLDPGLAHGPLFGELIPSLVSRHLPDLSYLPSSPWGGERPFRTDVGVAHYFGVGGYRRALCDVRRSAVRFASECLAIANVPDEEALAEMGAGAAPALGSAAWKQGVPRDAGSPWDFEDVRDHYLALLYRVDPARLRAEDPERYLELSRATSGELMAEVFSEWRRPGSPCAGGLVLWLADLRPGTGWGLMDHRRRPKPALHLLRPLLAPVAVFMTDEGLNGVAVHLVNDSSEVVRAQLRIGLYRDRQTLVGGIGRELELAPRSASSHDLEALIGGFLDAGWAYRFGPPAQDLIVVTLERPGGEGSPIAQAFHHVRGRPAGTESAGALGLSATLRRDSEGGAVAILRAERYVHNVRVQVGGTVADRAWFGLEPGRPREVRLGGTPLLNDAPALEPLRGRVIATNLIGALSLVEEV